MGGTHPLRWPLGLQLPQTRRLLSMWHLSVGHHSLAPGMACSASYRAVGCGFSVLLAFSSHGLHLCSLLHSWLLHHAFAADSFIVSLSTCESLSKQKEGYARGIFTLNFFQAFATWVVYTPLERARKICHLYYKNRTLQMCQNPWFHQTDAVAGDGRVASFVKYVLRLYSKEEVVHTYVLCTALEKSQWSHKKKASLRQEDSKRGSISQNHRATRGANKCSAHIIQRWEKTLHLDINTKELNSHTEMEHFLLPRKERNI